MVLLPVEYDDDIRPAVLPYTPETDYRLKLAKYISMPITEYAVILKEKGNYVSYIAQVAFDISLLTNNKKYIAHGELSGWLLLTDWNEELLKGAEYVKGKKTKQFDSEKQTKGRLLPCQEITFTYETYRIVPTTDCPGCTGIVLDTFEKIVVTRSYIICPDSSGSYNYPEEYYQYTGAGGSTGGTSMVITPTYPPPVNYVLPYDIGKVIEGGTRDRELFNFRVNENFQQIWGNYGNGVSLVSFTYDKARALAASTGGYVEKVIGFPLNFKTATGTGNIIGVVGVTFSFGNMVMSFIDGEWNQEDLVNFTQVILGGVALAYGGWIAVVAGGVSIVISGYMYVN